MSSRIFQGVILQMKDATDRCIGVIDSSGAVVACSELSRIGEKRDSVLPELGSAQDPAVTFEEYAYKPLSGTGARFDFAAFIQGGDEFAKSMCTVVAIALNGAKTSYDEKHDKATFVKNIILDNILLGDIYVRSRELNFDGDIPRAVLLIRQQDKNELATVDVLQSLFPDKQNDFVININETDVALIKRVKSTIDSKDLQKLAKAIEETIKSELYVKTVIGIGSVSRSLKDLAGAYKEAQVAIEVGKVFDAEKTIINYENLGIGRLIYQLPDTLCRMFLSEVFKKNSIDSLDQETLFTILKFFENNLNVSETSRKLFVHRNTLVYRLEKIKKFTGLDLREFDHAIIFKVALMVKKYLASQDGAL